MHSFSFRSLILLTLAAGASTVVSGANWPGFRGPNGSGVAATGALPAEFSPKRKYCLEDRAARGKLAGETSKVVAASAGQSWAVIAVNNLEESVYATPAIGDGRLYIRTETALYAFGARRE